MVENEILYVASALRWKETRRALAAGVAVEIAADRFIEDMDRGLRNSLVWRALVDCVRNLDYSNGRQS